MSIGKTINQQSNDSGQLKIMPPKIQKYFKISISDNDLMNVLKRNHPKANIVTLKARLKAIRSLFKSIK